MIPLEDNDLFLVYSHTPTKRIIGLTAAMNGGFLKVQLEPAVNAEWGNISLWTDKEINIFESQYAKGEIELLKFPSDFSSSWQLFSQIMVYG